MRWFVLAAITAALAVPAAAGEASFDCSRAATAVEKAICDDGNGELSFRDRAMAKLYGSVKEGDENEAALNGQKAWLAKRDACGSDTDCIAKSYDRRLVELARAGGDRLAVTGSYHYSLSPDTDTGTAIVVRMADGSLFGVIETVSGPTFHTCDVEFEDALDFDGSAGMDDSPVLGMAWLWTSPEDEVDQDGKRCQIMVRGDGKSLRIDSQNCTSYCGARGWFDSVYKRVK